MHQRRYLFAQDLSYRREAVVRVIPTGKEHEPMLYDHRQQFGVDLTEDPPGIRGVPVVQQAMLFPQLEEQFDLPSSAQQGQGLLEGEPAGRDIGHYNRPVGQFQQQGIDRLAMSAGILPNALLTLGGHFGWHALGQQAHASEQFAGSHIYQQVQPLALHLRQDRQQIQALVVQPQHDACLVTHQKEHALLGQTAQPLQRPIAQVSNPQTARQHDLFAQDEAPFMPTAFLQMWAVQVSLEQIQPHGDLETGLRLGVSAPLRWTASTAAPYALQDAGQADGGAIFNQHRGELLQQGQLDSVGAHHQRDGTAQERQQPVGSALGPMAVQVLLAQPHSQAPSKARKRAGTSSRLLPPAQDQHVGQLCEGHCTLPQAIVLAQLDGIVFKQGAQSATHSCYTRHDWTPARKTKDVCCISIFSQERYFVMPFPTSSILNLTPMGMAFLLTYHATSRYQAYRMSESKDSLKPTSYTGVVAALLLQPQGITPRLNAGKRVFYAGWSHSIALRTSQPTNILAILSTSQLRKRLLLRA